MAFYFLLYWHFLVMVMLVMLLSGLISAIFPRLHFIIIVFISGLLGFAYALAFNAKDLAIFPVIINIVFSLIAIGLIKYVFFLKKKAEEYKNSDI